jgi:RNA polymerase sigma factor (sigma-70 family)
MRRPDNPFDDTAGADPGDRDLPRRAQAGSREALEQLIARHQPWIYNIVLRMLYHPQDAEDTTHEILVKVITKLCTFEARSSFRTWLYRIVVNHILNLKRQQREEWWSFQAYARALDGTPDLELSDTTSIPADTQLLVSEAKIQCTTAMLLCLDREQRLVYVLGAILSVTDKVGAELLQISRDNFRQKLARARRDLHSFMHDKCGLVNTSNPCRCARKTQGFINAGYLDPERLLFAKAHTMRVSQVAERTCDDIDALDQAYDDIHRGHPFQPPPDFIDALRKLLNRPEIQSFLRGPQGRGN